MSGIFAGGPATYRCNNSGEHTYHIHDIDTFEDLYSVIPLSEFDIVTAITHGSVLS